MNPRLAPIGIFALLLALSATPAAAWTLSGRITRASDGAAVHPCDIDVYDRNTGTPVAVVGDTTDALGDYAIALPTGRYEVWYRGAFAARLFDVSIPDLQLSADLVHDEQLLSGRLISGRLTDAAGAGLSAVAIRFHDAAGGTPDNIQDGATDPTGAFATLVDPGLWDVSFVAPLAMKRVPMRVPGIDLTTSDVVRPDQVLASGHLVEATVTDVGFFSIVNADLDVAESASGAAVFTPGDNTDATGTAWLVLPSGMFDITAAPYPGGPYATVTARAIGVTGDQLLPNFALPPGALLSGFCRRSDLTPVAAVDIDVDSLPALGRLETSSDVTASSGTFEVMVHAGSFRITFVPPVSTRLLPQRVTPVSVAGATSMGAITLANGHWVDATVLAQGSGAPVPGTRLRFDPIGGVEPLLLAADRTNALGTLRVVTDAALYRLRVIPPSAAFDTLVVEPFRTLADTALTLTLVPRTAAAAPSATLRLSLAAPWPNPARGVVRFEFSGGAASAASADDAELSVWDAAGRRVTTAWRGVLAGARSLAWTPQDEAGRPLAPGVYVVRLAHAQGAVTRRLAILR